MQRASAPSAPLYTLTNGSRKAYSGGSETGNNGDVKVSNGNHFYFYKRWGGNAALYFAPLTVGDAPFAVLLGDEIRTVIKFDDTKTTGAGVSIIFGKYTGLADLATYNAYNTTLLTADKTDGLEQENTITISNRAYAIDEFFVMARPSANTSGLAWEADIEIYVNGVRYI